MATQRIMSSDVYYKKRLTVIDNDLAERSLDCISIWHELNVKRIYIDTVDGTHAL